MTHEVFEEISNGNADAKEVCVVLYEWLQAIDDLYDGDRREPIEWASVNLALMEMLGKNPFWQEHQDRIMPVLRAGVTAWIASEKMKNGGLKEQVISEVIKSQYMDIFFEIAYITGGWLHQNLCSEKFRGYYFG